MRGPSDGLLATIRSDRRYLVVVNRNVQEPMDLAVKLDPAVAVSLVTKDGRLHPFADNRYQAAMPAGDVAIFAWAAAGGEAPPAANSP